jgi:formylglycine-generating enzyme
MSKAFILTIGVLSCSRLFAGAPDSDAGNVPGMTLTMPAAESRAADKGGLLKMATLDLGGGVELNMVLIPAGEFMMGSRLSPSEAADRYDGEERMYRNSGYPQHRVRINQPFYIGSTEVTVGQFRQFIEATNYKTDAEKGSPNLHNGTPGGYAWGRGSTPWTENVNWRDPGFSQGDDSSVVMMSWNDAVAFCEWVSRKAGRRFRLPTEAEWEYACRAGTTTEYWWGDDMDSRFANVARYRPDENDDTPPPDDGYQNTSPAGHFPANGFGLYDMIGNVQEWCEDTHVSHFQADRAGSSQRPAAQQRVVRGGSWFNPGYVCRSSDHFGFEPEYRACYTGFRVVAEVAETSSRPAADEHASSAPSASQSAGWAERMVPNPHVPLPVAAPETPAEREYSALLRVVKRRQLTFEYVRSHVRQDQLPQLYKMLKDPALIGRSEAVASTIAYVAWNSKDDLAAEALIGYITRTDDWRGLDEKGERTLIYRRLTAGELFGLIGGKLANETLRRWIAPDGAKELAVAWGAKTSQHYQTEANLTHQIRYHAAVGLVLTQDPSNIALVKETYERESVYPKDWKEKGLYLRDMNTMTHAMVTQAFIEDHGIDAWLRQLGQGHQLMNDLSPYFDKYMSYPPDRPPPRPPERPRVQTPESQVH